MKFTAVLLSTFAAVAIAQSTVADTSYTKEQAACIKAAGTDGPKIAECLGAAAPTEEMVNDTTQCAMACVQGDGSPEETEAYAACQQNCITKKFFASTLGSDGTNTPATKAASSDAASATSSAASKASSAVASKVTSTASDGTVETASSTPSATEEDDATETQDGTAESESPASEDAATGLQAAGALTGFVALFAALFAL